MTFQGGPDPDIERGPLGTYLRDIAIKLGHVLLQRAHRAAQHQASISGAGQDDPPDQDTDDERLRQDAANTLASMQVAGNTDPSITAPNQPTNPSSPPIIPNDDPETQNAASILMTLQKPRDATSPREAKAEMWQLITSYNILKGAGYVEEAHKFWSRGFARFEAQTLREVIMEWHQSRARDAERARKGQS